MIDKFGTGTTYLEWWGNCPYVRKYLYDTNDNLD